MNARIAALTLAAAALAACTQDRETTGPARTAAAQLAAEALASSGAASGVVYTLTNQAAGNAVAVFARAADGTLTAAGPVPTGGAGTGAGLGSQGALALSQDGRWLFAVNAGSDEVSAFRTGDARNRLALTLTSRVASGGTQPISLDVHGDLLYVLNAGGDGNISGFTIGPRGTLHAIPGSVRPLSGSDVGPAQVAFSPDGRFLVVTEKNTNLLDVYAVGADGAAGEPSTVASSGATPFGFAFGLRNGLFVSEAAGTASSYALDAGGTPVSVSAAVDTHQGAPCWLAVTPDGRFAYTANSASGTITGFNVGSDAGLGLLDPDGASATVGTGNTDLAVSVDGRFLYQLIGGGSITALRVDRDGRLTLLGSVSDLPAGVVGLAAR